MDSITQIVLGAAVGEAVLGKKIGNRAMAWGALGGTIPDLDIIGNLFLDDISALAFHRGISHSLIFSIVAGLLMAWLLHLLYKWKENREWFDFGIASIFWTLIIAAMAGISYIASSSIVGVVLIAVVGILGLYKLYQDNVIDKDDYDPPTLMQWRWFWILALITHPILDSFTQFGTQLFAPFSDYRVAFNNISVADPIYTFTFIFAGLLPAAFFNRSDRRRSILNWTGIILSSAYMIFTIGNKLNTDKIMEATLVESGIKAERYMTSPSILNNILWSGTVETDSFYYQGLYSMLDKKKDFKLKSVPKNHHLIADAKPDDRTINILKWFSNDYYHILVRRDGQLQFNDMRYGTFRGDSFDEEDFIFNFVIAKGSDGYYKMIKENAGGPKGEEKEMMNSLIARIKGI